MRLIDADALKTQMAWYDLNELQYVDRILNRVLLDIDNAPTIDTDIMRPKWITVTERLPEPFLPVLIWYTYFMLEICITPEQTYGFGFVNLDGNWYIEGDGKQKKVIAWMPLPEPYDQEDAEQEGNP